jgi:hypothetical protein
LTLDDAFFRPDPMLEIAVPGAGWTAGALGAPVHAAPRTPADRSLPAGGTRASFCAAARGFGQIPKPAVDIRLTHEVDCCFWLLSSACSWPPSGHGSSPFSGLLYDSNHLGTRVDFNPPNQRLLPAPLHPFKHLHEVELQPLSSLGPPVIDRLIRF